jgi:hypothetical protein
MLNTDSLIVPLVQYIWHDNNKDYIQKDLQIINNIKKIDQLVINKKNVITLRKFLGNIHTPLRYSYLLDTKILISFVKIIKFFDLPFRFDLDKKFLWRYYAIPYGAYFDKKKRSFVSFFSMGLKKNIGVLMPFLLNYPSHSNLLHSVDWHKFSILFKNSLINNNNQRKNYNFNKNFFPTNDFNLNLIPISKHISSKRFHRSINLSDIDIDPWLSTFDYRFWTHDIYDPNYKISNLSKVDHIWGVHSSFINSSFLINSFDTKIILYPELYFKYLSGNYTIIKFLKNIKFFKKIFNISFYSNILNLFESFYIKTLKNINNKLIIFKNYNIIKIFKKSNNEKNIINYKIIKKFILFFIIFTNNKLYDINNLLFLRKSLYLFEPSKIIKRIYLRNYFYYRSRRYQKKPIKYNFRLFYLKKLPIGRIKKIRSFPVIYWKTKLRTIFYRNYRKFLFFRLKKFWNYFFSFFLQNIKKRFFFSNFIINQNITNIKDIYENYIYDLLFFLKKFFFFNRYLRKYFNLYTLNKRIKKNNKYTKKKFTNIFKKLSLYINKFIKLKKKKNTSFIKKNIKRKFNNIKYKY